MPLSPGDHIGPYEVIGLLGAGGIGQVYRARDTKLERMVAIKVLPDGLAPDSEQGSRFPREAKILAALNHPNIAAVYGWEDSGGVPALVMELVEGRPLNEVIPRKGMPLAEALKCAIQITRGLEAAHRSGVVHRDLKPSNVMVTAAGVVKLLDFGLAKQVAGQSHGSVEETVTAMRTAEGAIVGTIAYMSPEQAQGKSVDARTDLFSFGTMFFEMLTGERPFRGDNQVSTLAAILRDEPTPVSHLASVPSEVDRLMGRCLRKDPERRFQTASDLRVALEELADEASTGQLEAVLLPAQRRRSWWITAAVGLFAIAGTAYWMRPSGGSPARALRQLTFESGMAIMPALSPDGQLLVYASDRAGQGGLDLWVRQTAGGDPNRLTSGIGNVSNPQFSPDGTRVLFLSDASIFEISALGGQPRKLVESAGPFTVSSQGEIAFITPRTGIIQPIMIVPAAGGEPRKWRSDCESGAPPGWSSDGQRLAFTGTCGQDFGVFVAPREGGSPSKVPLRFEPNSGRIAPYHRVQWYPANGNSLEGLVLSLPNGDSTNLYRIDLDGSVAALTQGTGWEGGAAVSRSGDLVFSRAEHVPTIWSVPVAGGVGALEPPRKEAAPAGSFGVARDGSKLLFGRMAGMTQGHLVARDLAAGTETVIASHEVSPGGIGSFWTQMSPDSNQAVYRLTDKNAKGPYDINHCLVSLRGGAPRCQSTQDRFNLASGWRPDGARILGECEKGAICEMNPDDWSIRQIVRRPADGLVLYPSYSWDGKWIAFMHRTGGGTAIEMARVRDGAVASQPEWVRVSPADVKVAARPRFAEDGKVIFYLKNEGGVQHLMRQPVDLAAGRAGSPAVQIASVQVYPGWFADILATPTSMVDVSTRRVYFNSVELRGNVWRISLAQ